MLALDDDFTTRRPPTGSTPLDSEEDVAAYIHRQRSMTPAERLREAMED